MIPYNTVRPHPRNASGGHSQNAYQPPHKGDARLHTIGPVIHETRHDHTSLRDWPHVSHGPKAWDNTFVGALEDRGGTLISGIGQCILPNKPSTSGSAPDTYPLHEVSIPGGSISGTTTGSATHGALEAWPPQVSSPTRRCHPPRKSQILSTASKARFSSPIYNSPAPLGSDPSADLLIRPGLSPWTGAQSEDEVTQHTVRQGVFAKRLVKEEKEEPGTARHCVLPCLHKHTGVDALARFFNTILQEREASSKPSNVSMARGSPRVTLTEQKREAWLTKLADPTIPLRKQSRSIPHTLHGRVLLMQCASKNIPIARAVWLAKRIGLDSLRVSHRSRIGTTSAAQSEQKWLKDWTSTVVSFVEEVDDIEGFAQRTQEATYIARLSARLYDAGLLDREHFLDWLLNRLERCSSGNLSSTLRMVQTHQAELTSSKRCGQRLARASTLRLHELSESSPRNDDLKEVYMRLDNFVQGLASSHIKHFAVQTIWPQVRHMFVQKRNTAKEPSTVEHMQRIISMNDRLSPWVFGSDSNAVHPTQAVVQTLDGALPHLDLAALSSTLRTLIPDMNELVACLIGWTTSKYRAGGHRLHLAYRLIRQWHEQRILRSHDSISCALTTLSRSGTISLAILVRFCAEMSRSSQFDPMAYLRRLAVTQYSIKTHDMHFLSLLIAQVSDHDVPTPFIDFQAQVMQSTIIVTDSKAEVVRLKQQITVHFNLKSDDSEFNPQEEHSIQERLQKITLQDRFELSKSIRSSLLSLLARRTDGPDTSMPLHFVRVVVILLEDLDDYFALIDVLMPLVPRCSLEGLELIALSAETHDEKFGALGCHTKLWHALFSRYTALRSTNNPPHKDLCRFFLRTSYWYRTTAKFEQHLNREIEFCDNSFAACTPLSEMQIDTADDGRSELDSLLANGPKLADPDLLTALGMILFHLCHVKQIIGPQIDTIKANLNALRTANEASFEIALAKWLQTNLHTLEHQPLARVLTLLLSSESLSIAALLECGHPVDNGDLGHVPRIAEFRAALKILHFFFFEISHDSSRRSATHAGEDENLQVLDVHSRWTKQTWRQQLFRSHRTSLIRLLGSSLKRTPESDHDGDLQSLCTSPPFITMIQRLFAVSPGLMHDEFVDVLGMDAAFVRHNLRQFLAVMLNLPERPSKSKCLTPDSTYGTGSAEDSKALLISQLFESVDVCSLPTYQLAIRIATEDNGHSDFQLVLQSCSDHITTSAKRRCPLWSSLVCHIDVHIGKQLRVMSERALLFLEQDDLALSQAFQSAWTTTPSTYATIISATRNSIPASGESEIGRHIAEHLKSAVKAIIERLPPTSSDFIDWIRALIYISLVHEQAFTMSADLTQLLYSLCRITSLDYLQVHGDIVELARDAVCFFLPRATMEAVGQMRIALEPFVDASRIRELLDLPTEADTELFTRADVNFSLAPRVFQNTFRALS